MVSISSKLAIYIRIMSTGPADFWCNRPDCPLMADVSRDKDRIVGFQVPNSLVLWR